MINLFDVEIITLIYQLTIIITIIVPGLWLEDGMLQLVG